MLSEKAIAEIFTPQTIVTAEAFYPTARLTKPKWKTYGLGWFQQDYRGRAVDYHTGSIDGMVAIHGLLRDQNVGVYVLANRDHAELRHALMLERLRSLHRRAAPRLEHRAARALRRPREGGRCRASQGRGEAPRRHQAVPAAGCLRRHVHRPALRRYRGHDRRRSTSRRGTAARSSARWSTGTSTRSRRSGTPPGAAPSLVAFGLDEDGKPATVEAMGMKFTRAKSVPHRYRGAVRQGAKSCQMRSITFGSTTSVSALSGAFSE